MPPDRRTVSARLRDLSLGLVLGAPLVVDAAPGRALAIGAEIRLFRVVTMREDLVLGVTRAELEALGPGPDVERLARHLLDAGQLSGWHYMLGRAPEGGTQFAPHRRVAVLRQDALTIEPYSPALPVLPPPG